MPGKKLGQAIDPCLFSFSLILQILSQLIDNLLTGCISAKLLNFFYVCDLDLSLKTGVFQEICTKFCQILTLFRVRHILMDNPDGFLAPGCHSRVCLAVDFPGNLQGILIVRVGDQNSR